MNINIIFIAFVLSACNPNIINAMSSSPISVKDYNDKSYNSRSHMISCKTNSGDMCHLSVLIDGELKKLPIAMKYHIDSNIDAVFIQALGSIPEVKVIPFSEKNIILKSMVDSRSSYLIGFIKNTDKSKKVIIQKGMSRKIVYTDSSGAFKVKLPSGRYNIYASNISRVVDVPFHDSVILKY